MVKEPDTPPRMHTCHQCKGKMQIPYCYYQGKVFDTRQCWQDYQKTQEWKDRYRVDPLIHLKE